MKKKVLFVIPTLEKGGAERVVLHIANHLDRQKFIVEIVLIMKSGHHYLKDLKSDVKVIKLNLETRIRYSIFRTLVAIKKNNPDVVFLAMEGLNVLISVFIPFFKKYKWIARESNTVSVHFKKKKSHFLYKKFYKNYDTIIAQCNDMKKDLIANFNIPEQNINVINNPIDTDFIDKKLNENIETSLLNNRINLLACGRLTYQKGFDILINEFSKLKSKRNYHLTLLGGSSKKDPKNQEARLKELVKKFHLEECITFAGSQENSYKWFEKADIFILSSRYEGFSNVLLEALYCGTPALANNCLGGPSEVIIEGINGLIFDWKKGDFEAKLRLISKMTFDKSKIRQSVSAKFDVKEIIKSFENLI